MKLYADKKRREMSYEEGEWVYLKVRPYRQKTLANRINEKLGLRFYGPYKILQKLGQAAYKLDLPKDCQIHPVFRVSQLKKAEGVGNLNNMAAAPPLTADLEILMTPADILQVRQQGSKPREVLVLWKGIDESEATWEDAAKFFATFPDTHLEDKVLNWVGGIVTPKPPIIKTYQRRGKSGE